MFVADVGDVITLLLREEKNRNKTRKKSQTNGVGLLLPQVTGTGTVAIGGYM